MRHRRTTNDPLDVVRVHRRRDKPATGTESGSVIPEGPGTVKGPEAHGAHGADVLGVDGGELRAEGDQGTALGPQLTAVRAVLIADQVNTSAAGHAMVSGKMRRARMRL